MKLSEALKKAKAILSAVKLTQEPLIDNSLIQYDTDEITQGEVVYLCDGAGDWSILPDGKYQTKQNVKFVITDGIVTSVDNSSEIEPVKQPDPLPQAIDQSAATSGITDDSSTPGTGAINLESEDMSEDAKDEAGKPKYGNVEYADPGLQDDNKKRYPIDTAEHIRAAWNYINKEKNAGAYSPDNLAKVKNKIIAAWKDKIDKDGPPSAEKQSALDNPIVNAPGAGAPASLLTPAEDYSTCMSAISETRAQHNVLQNQHDKLQGQHDELRAAHQKLADKYEAMKVENDENKKALVKASAQIVVLSKQPAAAAIEEIKGGGFKNVPVEIAETKAFQIFNSK